MGMKVYTFDEYCRVVEKSTNIQIQEKEILQKEILQKAPILKDLLEANFVYLQKGERKNFVILDDEFLVVGLHRVRLTKNYLIKLGCDGQGRCFLCELAKRYKENISKSKHYVVFNVFDLSEKKVKLLLLFCEGKNIRNENFTILFNLSKDGKLQGTEIIVKLGLPTDKFQGYYIDGVVIAKRYKIPENVSRRRYNVRELFELKDFTFLSEFGYEIKDVEEKLNRHLIELQDDEDMLLVEELKIEEENEIDLGGEIQNDIIKEVKGIVKEDEIEGVEKIESLEVGEQKHNVIELNAKKRIIDLTKECLDKIDKSYMEKKLKEIERENKISKETMEVINTYW
ncbi:MAG: hypothetical protein QW067_08995 [Thermofilaceae archaeon]